MKDIIFIGGGPAGYAGAIRAKQRGMDVLVIEKDRLGGTCLNRGCIPTKTLVKNAEVLRELKHAEHYGLMIDGYTFDYTKVKARKDSVTEQLVSGIENLIKGHKIDHVKGVATFKDEHTVTVDGIDYQAKVFVICTGSYPFKAGLPGAEHEGVITSDDLLEMTEIPKRMAVLGTGVIGMEFASIFNEFGSEVHVIGSTLLKREDAEVVKRLQIYLKKQGLKLHLGARPERIEKKEDGLHIYFPGKKGEEEVVCDVALMATGRKPAIEELGLDIVGIKYDAKGIKVNEKMQTNLAHIYACGDCLGKIQLAHLATAEALAIVENLAGHPAKVNYDAIPSCTFVYPEVASVGKTEEELKLAEILYRSAKFNFIANGKALAMNQTDGFVKVLADESGKLLGVHILGPGASDLIAEATLAVQNGLLLENIEQTIHAHPTLAEAIHEAVSAIEGIAIHAL